MVGSNAFIDNVALCKKHHPRRNGGTNHRNNKRNEMHVRRNLRHHGSMGNIAPVGTSQKRSNDVRHEHEGNREENLLDAFIASLHHEQPHDYGGNRHAYPGRHAEKPHARCNTGKFAERRSDVANKQRAHGECGKANAEALANKGGEAFARYRAHASSGHLHDEQQHAHHGDNPKCGIPEIGARRRICRNAARIVTGHGAYDARTHSCKHEQEERLLLFVGRFLCDSRIG